MYTEGSRGTLVNAGQPRRIVGGGEGRGEEIIGVSRGLFPIERFSPGLTRPRKPDITLKTSPTIGTNDVCSMPDNNSIYVI